MKIGGVIRKYRKEIGIAQEEIAAISVVMIDITINSSYN